MIVEGASHFAPVRLVNKDEDGNDGEDIFKINDTFIGAYPNDVQDLTAKIVIKFLTGLEQKQGLDILKRQNSNNLNFHILSQKEVKEISEN